MTIQFDRPTPKKVTAFSLDTEIIDLVATIAKRDGVSRSYLVQEVLTKALAA